MRINLSRRQNLVPTFSWWKRARVQHPTQCPCRLLETAGAVELVSGTPTSVLLAADEVQLLRVPVTDSGLHTLSSDPPGMECAVSSGPAFSDLPVGNDLSASRWIHPAISTRSWRIEAEPSTQAHSHGRPWPTRNRFSRLVSHWILVLPRLVAFNVSQHLSKAGSELRLFSPADFSDGPPYWYSYRPARHR